jgi:hypothetical protein
LLSPSTGRNFHRLPPGAHAAQIEKERGDNDPKDEGYKRAKAKAEQKLNSLIETLKAA